METTSSSNPGLADLSALPTFKQKPKDSASGTAAPGTNLLQVVLETPRGSRNKYSYDADQRTFALKSLLPAGMVFPFDFGFVPGTLGGDGDPLDVLVFMEEPGFPGCTLLVRPLGVMEVEQTEDGEVIRNDRLLAVADMAPVYASFHEVDDLPTVLREQIEAFFANYHALLGKDSHLLAWGNRERASLLLQEARKRAPK